MLPGFLILYLIKHMKLKFLILILLFIFSIFPGYINSAFAQKSKNQLEKEKEETLAKISETNKILNETKHKRQATLGQLSAIQEQILARNSLINSIGEEINYIDGNINETEDIIRAIQKDVVILKREYAAMLYAAAKSQNYYDKLTFIFSAQTFNQLVKRLKYFKQYAGGRKNQVKQIEAVKKFLSLEKEKLNQQREEKNKLLYAKTVETQSLTRLRNHHAVR